MDKFRGFLAVLILGAGSTFFITEMVNHVYTRPLQSSFADNADLSPNDTTAKQNWLTDALLRNNPLGKFPSVGVCRYLGIRKQPAESEESDPANVVCQAHSPTDDSCETANSYYGKPGYTETRHCDEKRYPDICHFRKTNNLTFSELECDIDVCNGNTLTTGSINPKQGIVTHWETVQPFSTKKLLSNVYKSIAFGFDFIFLKCGRIFQVLVFPPVIKAKRLLDKRQKININIVLLDSISRPHFYRVLLKSVAALRQIVYKDSIPATALDFELFQSIGQSTFDNMRPLFSGVLRGDAEFSRSIKSSMNPLGVPVLFGKYKKSGYQTMFQEDICWFDRWGIMLTDIERRTEPSNKREFESRWKEFKKQVSKKMIDKYGLTHFSCLVCQKYGYTNHYNDPEKLCLNGKFFSHYFLDYTMAVFAALKNDRNAAPLISYFHFNTGHSYSGTRIRNIDEKLAKFLTRMAFDPYTLTLVMSDHGHKSTLYGQTEEGRRELFDPSLFIILPYDAAELLGKDRVTALVENQHRLFTTADLHRGLMSLVDPTGEDTHNPKNAEIFSVLPTTRTCADLPLMPLTRCKCEGTEQFVADNSLQHKWLAEFGLGQLNNVIQEQYMKGQSRKHIRGYGKCTRLVGRSYDHTIERHSASVVITNFDLHFAPPAGYKEDEVIKVEIQHPLEPENGVTMKSFQRQSQYSKFQSCADESVDIKLCTCAQRNKKSVVQSMKDMKALISQPMFGARTELKNLHSGCVILMTRRHQTITVAYEIANICRNKTFKVIVRGEAYNMILSRSVPISVTLRPRTIHFLLSTIRYVMNDSYFTFNPTVELVS